MTDTQSRQRLGRLAAATAIAWLGFYIHNVAELPGQTLLSPETLLPTLITVALFLACWLFPTSGVALWLLFGWATLNLVGGAMSVLPLPLLPFYPEQSVRHYAFHVVYAVAQVPLIILIWTWLQQRG